MAHILQKLSTFSPVTILFCWELAWNLHSVYTCLESAPGASTGTLIGVLPRLAPKLSNPDRIFGGKFRSFLVGKPEHDSTL